MAYKDLEKAKAYYRSYEETHREQHAARQRAYLQRRATRDDAEAWREKISERRRAFRQDNDDYARKHAERQRRYRQKNPEARAADRARRRQPVSATFTAEDRAESIAWRKLIKDDPCFYCGAAETHHVDHYVSLINGGTEHWWNLVRACASCNYRKNRMNGDEFLALLRGSELS